VDHLKRIIFDVDNVLADSITCWCKKASSHLGYPVSKEDIKSHKIVGSVPMLPREIFRLQDEVWREWRQLPPTEEDIPEKLLILKNRGFKVYIATSRPLRSASLVRSWINHMRIPYDCFYPLGPFKVKAEIDSDFLVDDAPDQILSYIAKERTGFLYEQPWNRKVDIPKAVVIHNITELLSYLK
jgi:5'(3')-deoxyribonucleotidase